MFFAGNGEGDFHDYIYVRDCSDNGRSGSAPNSYALCCFFSVRNSLVELCLVAASKCTSAIYFKGTNVDCTARGNNVNVTDVEHALTTGFAPDGAPDRIEICYNTVIAAHVVSAGTEPNNPYGEHWFYRNSLVGPWLRAYTPDAGGPYVFENNVVVTDVSPIVSSGTSVTNSGTECQGATSFGIVDAAGQLAGAYRTNYLGMRGAEIA